MGSRTTENTSTFGPQPLTPNAIWFSHNPLYRDSELLPPWITKSIWDGGGIAGAVFLDLKKAFDTVNHHTLLAKWSYFNFSADAIQWMESYLTNRTQSAALVILTPHTLTVILVHPRGQYWALSCWACTLMTCLQSVHLWIYKCMLIIQFSMCMQKENSRLQLN